MDINLYINVLVTSLQYCRISISKINFVVQYILARLLLRSLPRFSAFCSISVLFALNLLRNSRSLIFCMNTNLHSTFPQPLYTLIYRFEG